MQFKTEIVGIDTLRPHPRNYKTHPDDQIAQIKASITKHGYYRAVVIAKDGTILAGHGVVIAARELGHTTIPVKRLPIASDSPEAMQIMIGDNELGHLAERDDRQLSMLLKELSDINIDALIGTGYDAQMLANLVYVTRPASEVADFDEAAHWVGLPEYEPLNDQRPRVILIFADVAAREEFANRFGYAITDKTKSIQYPLTEKRDMKSIRFEQGNAS